MTGTWIGTVGMAHTVILEAHAGGFGVTTGKDLIIDPADGIIPYQPWALAERRFVFAGGTHTFTARVNDGVRVFVDGSLVINRWVDVASATPAIYTATSTLAAGEHEIKVEYYERSGVAEIQVSW